MPPAKRRRRMNAAELGCLRQALALDHRSGVIEPAVLLAQMRHRRLGQCVERAPAALAAKPQKAMRAAPADDFSARAMGTALAFHTLMAGRSKRVLATVTLRRLGPLRLRRNLRTRTRLLAFRSLERLQGRPSLRRAQARNRTKPPRKVLSLHRRPHLPVLARRVLKRACARGRGTALLLVD